VSLVILRISPLCPFYLRISLPCPLLSSEYPRCVPCYPHNIITLSLVILGISLLCPLLSSEYPCCVPFISEYLCCVPCYPRNIPILSLVILGISPFCPPARAACTCHHTALQFPGEQCSGTFRVDELIGTLRCTLHQGQGTKLGRSSRISLLQQKRRNRSHLVSFLSGIKRSLVFLFYHKTYFCTFFVKSRLLVIPGHAEFGSFRRHCVCCLACRV
jgi:hypothetical protein